MSYRVSLSTALNTFSVKHYMSRTQAIHGMRKAAYEVLGNFGKLDTIAAVNVMTAIGHCDDIIPPQDQKSVEISNTGFTLTIFNTARSPK